MTKLRCTDASYGAAYWNSMDSGAGYVDGLLPSDLVHDLWEVFIVDWHSGQDRSGEHSHLDVGCAFGFVTRHFRRRGVESWGVDISEYALGNAPDDVRDHLRPHDLRTGNDTFFGTDRFSLVTSFETLEHIAEEHVDNAIGTIVRAVRPGGWLAMTICVEGQHGWESDPTHVTIKPREWWEERFVAAGVEHRPGMEDQLRRFWLFSQHRGVFVFKKPA